MAHEQPAPGEAQDQSIKSRKRQLYEAAPAPGAADDRKPMKTVQDYLRETPATPVSTTLKAALWGSGGLVVLLFFAVLLFGDRRPKQTVAGEMGPEPLPVARGSSAAKPPDLAAATPAPAQPNPPTPPDRPAPSRDAKKDGADKAKEKPKAPEKIEWRLKADPTTLALAVPAGQDLTIPVPDAGDGAGQVLFPTTPSPYVAVGENRAEGEARELWDLRNRKRLGLIRGSLKILPPYTLSPDGTFLAARVEKGKDEENKNDNNNRNPYGGSNPGYGGAPPGSVPPKGDKSSSLQGRPTSAGNPQISLINNNDPTKDDQGNPIVLTNQKLPPSQQKPNNDPTKDDQGNSVILGQRPPAGQQGPITNNDPTKDDQGNPIVLPIVPTQGPPPGQQGPRNNNDPTKDDNGNPIVPGQGPPSGQASPPDLAPANDKKDEDKNKDDKDKESKEQTGDKIGVWSFKTGKEIKIFKHGLSTTDYLEFVGPDQLLVGNVASRSFEIYDVTKGERIGAFKVVAPFDLDSLALSPGRKFLAMTSLKEGRLLVYDVIKGEPVGDVPLPKGSSRRQFCAGMVFSNDGKELAAVFDTAGKPRILCWETATGKQVADRGLDERLNLWRAPEDQGRALEWLPDKSGWLVYGQAMIDRQSGHRFWSLPLDPVDFPPAPRRIVDNERILLVANTARGQAVKASVLPKDKVAAARQLARSGGSPVDAILPPAKVADLSTKHAVPAAAGSWSVKPDPMGRPSKPLVSRPIALKGKLFEIQQVLCSGPEAPQALVALRTRDRSDSYGNVTAAGQSFAIERYDLANGKRLTLNDLPPAYELFGFSPDANRMLFRDTAGRERLDVLATADLKPVAAWRPYEKETGFDRSVIWAAFLDQHRVLTINPAGKLALWALPDCRAVYVLPDAFQGTPVLSPGRKNLAGFAKGSIRFLDPATGQQLGTVPAPSADDGGKPGLMAGAFRPDGAQLAALLNGNQLISIDLKEGKVTSEFRSPAPPGVQLEWCGPRHVLVNNRSLVDLDRQREVWRYASGIASPTSPDGRHWAAVEAYANAPAFLAGFALPDKNLDKIVTLVVDKKIPALLQEGASVGLRVEANGASKREVDKFKKAVTQQFTDQLRALKITVSQDEPVTLVVRAEEIETGRMVERRELTPGMPDSDDAKKPVSLRNLEYDIALVDQAGKATLEPKQTINLVELGPVRVPPEVKDGERYLSYRLFEAARNRIADFVIPPFVARGPEGVVRFPGFTNLGHAK